MPVALEVQPEPESPVPLAVPQWLGAAGAARRVQLEVPRRSGKMLALPLAVAAAPASSSRVQVQPASERPKAAAAGSGPLISVAVVIFFLVTGRLK